MKRAVKRARREHLPPLPKTIAELDNLPEQYQVLQGENWLLHDSGQDEHRFLVFCKPRVVRRMAQSRRWYMDGTFRTRPLLVGQIYTILYDEQGHAPPGAWVLMTHRTEDMYTSLFNVLKEAMPAARNTGPGTFSIDFEISVANAFTTVFPNSEPQFCFFHFSQSLWRKAQQSGIAQRYQNNEENDLRSQFHSILALAFVPEADVPNALAALREVCEESLDDVLDLVEEGGGRGRGAVRFPPRTWNVYQRTRDGIPRTNKTTEAWSRRRTVLISKTHPNVYEFLEALKDEEMYAAAQRRLVELGEEVPKKKKKYHDNDERLVRLVSRYAEITGDDDEDNEENPWDSGILRYLRAVGHSARGTLDN